MRLTLPEKGSRASRAKARRSSLVRKGGSYAGYCDGAYARNAAGSAEPLPMTKRPMSTRMTLSYWSPRAALIAALLCAAPVTALPASADDVPSLVHRAVTQYGAEHHGLLGFSRHVNFTMHAGPLSRDVRNDVGVLMQDGAYTRVRYYAGQTDAKTDDAKDLQRQEDEANADLAAGRG